MTATLNIEQMAKNSATSILERMKCTITVLLILPFNYSPQKNILTGSWGEKIQSHDCLLYCFTSSSMSLQVPRAVLRLSFSNHVGASGLTGCIGRQVFNKGFLSDLHFYFWNESSAMPHVIRVLIPYKRKGRLEQHRTGL